MSKTESGYAITIRAFLPCGPSAADHAGAKSCIDQLRQTVASMGCIGVVLRDDYKGRSKYVKEPVAESSDG